MYEIIEISTNDLVLFTNDETEIELFFCIEDSDFYHVYFNGQLQSIA